MKRQLLLGIMLVTAGGISAQVNVSTTPSNRVAVLEEYTGNYCTFCPDGHLIATDDIEPTGAVTIKIQTGGFSQTDPVFGGTLQTPTGELIAGPFDSDAYPNGTVSRAGSGYNGIGRGSWVNAVNTIQSQASPVNLYVESSLDATTRELTVSVEYYYTGAPSSGTNYLHIGYYQDNVPAYQYDPGFNPAQFYVLEDGVYDFDHCFRDMVNGTWGEAVNGLTAGSTGIITHNVTLPASFSTFDVEAGAIRVYAFMSQSAQGTIITAGKATPSVSNWPNADDAGIIYATSVKDENCVGKSGSYQPKILVGAKGSNTLNTLSVNYGVNGGSDSDNLTALNLDPSEKKTVTLPATNFTFAATNNFSFDISEPNGQVDPTSGDNEFVANVVNSANAGNADKIRIEVKGDAYMTQESSFIVRDGSGAVMLNVPKAQMLNSGTKTWDLTIPAGVDCYTFELDDEYGDGWGYQTTSHFKVFNYTGDVLGSQIKLIDSDNTLEYSLIGATEITSAGSSASIETLSVSEVSVYPNPATSVLNVAFEGLEANYTVSLLDLSGRAVATQNSDVNGLAKISFDVSNIEAGSYIVSIASERGVHIEHVVVK